MISIFNKMNLTTLFVAGLLSCNTATTTINDSIASKESEKELISAKGHPILFYNVENLFDTKDNPKTSDEEFTPDGFKKWSEDRYNDKLGKLAKVILASGKKAPVLIGLAEIENRKVVEDLVTTNEMKKTKYKVVHEESPDNRGIDVALVYDSERFLYIKHQSYRVDFPWDATIKSRDILMVQGVLAGNDTVNIFVNHWPSRRKGKEASEPKRMQAAKKLKEAIEAIKKSNPNAKILCMGDFNDHPSDNSLMKGLGAGEYNAPSELINLMLPLEKDGLGSHNYRGEWGMLDQIIVSSSFIKSKSGNIIKDKKAHILKEEWMLYYNDKGEASPSKTYGGPNYYGGYSDHLPVYVILK